MNCIELKEELQAEVLKSYEGLSQEEMMVRRKEFLATSDDPWAQWWRELPLRITVKPSDLRK